MPDMGGNMPNPSSRDASGSFMDVPGASLSTPGALGLGGGFVEPPIPPSKHYEAKEEYDRFLSQISGLQGDLGHAVNLCRQLRRENDSLRQAFARVRNDALSFRKRWEQARGHALKEADARVQAENGHDEAIREFRSLLDGKEEEL